MKRRYEIGARNWVAAIADVVEDLLDEHGIYIPDDDRNGDEGEACLYGKAYSDLENDIADILTNLFTTIKENPDVNMDFYSYER